MCTLNYLLQALAVVVTLSSIGEGIPTIHYKLRFGDMLMQLLVEDMLHVQGTMVQSLASKGTRKEKSRLR